MAGWPVAKINYLYFAGADKATMVQQAFKRAYTKIKMFFANWWCFYMGREPGYARVGYGNLIVILKARMNLQPETLHQPPGITDIWVPVGHAQEHRFYLGVRQFCIPWIMFGFLCLLLASLLLWRLRNRIGVNLHQASANSINIKMGFYIVAGIVLPFMPLLWVVNNPLDLIGNSSRIPIFN